MDATTFVELTAIGMHPDRGEATKVVLNLRNVRAVVEEEHCSVVETSAASVGTVRVAESWEEMAQQARTGSALAPPLAGPDEETVKAAGAVRAVRAAERDAGGGPLRVRVADELKRRGLEETGVVERVVKQIVVGY